MRLKSCKVNAPVRLLMLGTTSLLVACQSISGPTDTTGTTPGDVSGATDRAIVALICRDVAVPISYSASRDTPETVREIQAYNAGRIAYGCTDG